MPRRTRTQLAELGFSQKGVEDRLGLDSMSQLEEASRTRAAHLFPVETPQDHLIALFVFGHSVLRKTILAFLAPEVVEFLLHTGLVAESRDGTLVANVFLLPFRSLLVASDRHDRNRPDEVWTPSTQTFTAERFLPDESGQTLDIATGNGILALLMSGRSERVHGIDINPRAIDFARFNAWFNELSNVSFETVSFGEFVIGSAKKFGLVTGVLPDLLVGMEQRPGPVSRVVSDGRGLLKEIYDNLDAVLEPGGLCVFWHGIAASKASIREFFERHVVERGNLPRGFEVAVVSVIKGAQETGVFLVRKGSADLPPLCSRVSPSLGITDPVEVFEVTRSRRRFRSMQGRGRRDVRLGVREGLTLWVEHGFQNGSFRSRGCQIGRYRLSPDVLELLQLIDGVRTFGEIADRFLQNKLGVGVEVDAPDRRRVERTLCELVDMGIVELAESDQISDMPSVDG